MHDQNHNFTALLIHTLICTVYQANKGAIQWSDFLASKVGCVWHISHNMCNPLYRISQNLQEYPVHALLFCRSVMIRHIQFAAAIRWLTGVKTISRRRGRVEWIFLRIARVASLRFFFFQDNRRHLWDSSGKCPMNTLKIWIALHAEKKNKLEATGLTSSSWPHFTGTFRRGADSGAGSGASWLRPKKCRSNATWLRRQLWEPISKNLAFVGPAPLLAQRRAIRGLAPP